MDLFYVYPTTELSIACFSLTGFVSHTDCLIQRHVIGNSSIQYTNWFLKEIAEEVNQVIIAIYEEHCKMGDKVGDHKVS